MRNPGTWWILALVMLLLDIYVYQAVKTISLHSSEKMRLIVSISYWILSGVVLALLVSFPYFSSLQVSGIFRNYVMTILLGLFIAKLAGSIFFLADDIRRVAAWAFHKIAMPATNAAQKNGKEISRSVFLSWAGIGIGASLFGTLLYGFSNKYNYQLKKIKLSFPNLPEAFKGMKMVHISDIHSGSFRHKAAVSKGVDMILAEKPDIVFFTGDLVNDRADEMENYIDVFSRIQAPMGVYSSLGNHDYGDYVSWPSPQAKQDNLERLKQVHGQMGWKLLLNEHILLQKNEAQIAVLGVENWSSKKAFPTYGKMASAYPGTEHIPFKILLSHDPTHWDAEIRTQYPDIDLTLSGHTHGMQFGIENPYFRWSPVQWVYKQWAGLYEYGTQKLYINRGYGFIGYPGRVGILPEITLFELA